jgi:flagellar biogenesis protein FliO
MKKYFLHFFLLLATCISINNAYSETGPSSIEAPAPLPQHLQETPNAHETKSPKNYFDIKVDEKEGDRFFSEFINMLTTLGIIVLVILIATWFLKKLVNSRIEQLNTTSHIKIVERRNLNPKTSLYLIDINGSGFILAESTNGVTSLGSFDINEMEKGSASSFKDVMNTKEASS